MSVPSNEVHPSQVIALDDNSHDRYLESLGNKLASLVVQAPTDTDALPVGVAMDNILNPSSLSEKKTVDKMGNTKTISNKGATPSVAIHVEASSSTFILETQATQLFYPSTTSAAAHSPCSINTDLYPEVSPNSSGCSESRSERSSTRSSIGSPSLGSPFNSSLLASHTLSTATSIRPLLPSGNKAPAENTLLPPSSYRFSSGIPKKPQPQPQLPQCAQQVSSLATCEVLGRPSLPLMTSGELSLEFEALMEADMDDLVARGLINWTPEQLLGDALDRVFSSCGDLSGRGVPASPPVVAVAAMVASVEDAAEVLEGQLRRTGRGGGANCVKRQLGRLLLCGTLGGCCMRRNADVV